MKRIGLIVSALLALWALRWGYIQILGSDEMEYRGAKIKLTRKYADYDDYKNDPHNLSPSERKRVEAMMIAAQIGPTFRDLTDFERQVSDVKFPGYGEGGGPTITSTGRKLLATAVEIPDEVPDAKNRVFVIEQLPDKTWKLVDDFVWAGEPFLLKAEVDGTSLRYIDTQGRVVREKPL